MTMCDTGFLEVLPLVRATHNKYNCTTPQYMIVGNSRATMRQILAYVFVLSQIIQKSRVYRPMWEIQTGISIQ